MKAKLILNSIVDGKIRTSIETLDTDPNLEISSKDELSVLAFNSVDYEVREKATSPDSVTYSLTQMPPN